MSVVVPVTVVGNLVKDPELRFTPSGKAVADFRVAENHKQYSQETKKWETVGTTFYRVNAWGGSGQCYCRIPTHRHGSGHCWQVPGA